MIILVPLPIPYSEMISQSQTRNIVPAVIISIAVRSVAEFVTSIIGAPETRLLRR
jgi:hypothetical protein